MAKYFLFVLVMVMLTPYPSVASVEPDGCLPVRFFGGQSVQIIGSVDVGGLPFRDDPSLSEPIEGVIPLGSVVESRQMQQCVEGRNWYTVMYALNEDDQPREVWVVDGDGSNYWLEPTLGCANDGRINLLPSYPDYGLSLMVDGVDEENSLIRFSAEYSRRDSDISHTREQHYFTFNLNTNMVTKTEYWHRDLITRELTDRLGITEQVFGDGEDFSRIYVSPDRTKILYTTPNPPIQDCAHYCQTYKLWLANSDGTDPIVLDDFPGNNFSRLIWQDTGEIHISMSETEAWSPEFTVTFFTDGREPVLAETLLLSERSLPFDQIHHMPVWSPNGEWIAVTAGSQADRNEGIEPKTIILENEGERYIELPYNGGAALNMVWLDEDTILYPVIGTNWQFEPYEENELSFPHDIVWVIELDFEALTYKWSTSNTTYFDGRERDERMFYPMGYTNIYHMAAYPSGVIIYSWDTLRLYCFSSDRG